VSKYRRAKEEEEEEEGGKLPRLSDDSQGFVLSEATCFVLHYQFTDRTCPETKPPAKPETKTEPQPRSQMARLIVRARATDARNSRGAKDSEQKTHAYSPIMVPEEREESRKRSKEEKREKTFFLSQALTLPHAVLVTMVGNSKKENPWMSTKGCPSLAASHLSLASVPRGRSQQQQERQRAKGG